ncbi:MAG: BMC domain-containing protein [Lachnospiraceae bacterium]|nr:BMC domain-containing protein [Lachnospiraceae bacterium]
MRYALGLVEVAGLCPAIATCDVMLKAANVTIVEIERAKGGGYTVIKVEGDVAAVQASCQAGSAFAKEDGTFVSLKVIPRPEKSTCNFFAKHEFDRKTLYRL